MYATWLPLASAMMVNLPGRDVALVGVPEPDTTSGGHAPAHPPLQTVDGGTVNGALVHLTPSEEVQLTNSTNTVYATPSAPDSDR